MAFIKTGPEHFDGKTTKGLYLGKPEAEGENNPNQGLAEYYEDFLRIDSAIAKGKFLIVGRKGVGKSAYVKHLCDNSSIDNEILCTVVGSNSSFLQRIIQVIPDNVGNKACLIYEWIILTELVKLILSNTSLQFADGYDALLKSKSKNSGIVDIDKWMLTSMDESFSIEVNFFDLMKHFPLVFAKSVNKSQSKAPFYRILPSLKEVVLKMLGYDVNKGINYIVMFDDLDIHFDLRSDTNKEELMDLIRLARDYNTKFFPNNDIKILLFMRDDIAMYLDGVSPDKNKIFSSYGYKLQWYNSVKEIDEEDSLLRKFINKRIKIGYEENRLKYNHMDPWSSLVDNFNQEEYNWKTAFKYILDCTLYRPRDLVAFFDGVGDCNYHIPLGPKEIKRLLKRYVNWNANEVKDELSNMYNNSQRDSIFSIFMSIAQSSGGMKYNSLLELMQKKGLTEEDFSILVDYNYLIPKDDYARQYFPYRERVRLNAPENYSYSLPKCLFLYFRQDLI